MALHVNIVKQILVEVGAHPIVKVSTGEYAGHASDFSASIPQTHGTFRELTQWVEDAGFTVLGYTVGTGTPHDTVQFNQA